MNIVTRRLQENVKARLADENIRRVAHQLQHTGGARAELSPLRRLTPWALAAVVLYVFF